MDLLCVITDPSLVLNTVRALLLESTPAAKFETFTAFFLVLFEEMMKHQFYAHPCSQEAIRPLP